MVTGEEEKIYHVSLKMVDRKEIMNELFDSLLITCAAVGVSMVYKKILSELLGTPESIKGTLRLTAEVGLGTLAVKYAQDRSWIPTNPFSK